MRVGYTGFYNHIAIHYNTNLHTSFVHFATFVEHLILIATFEAWASYVGFTPNPDGMRA